LDLPFPLVSDPTSKIARAYGVTRAGGWLPARRVTFVIDPGGIVRQVVTGELNIPEHARVALAAVKELADGAF
jgi:peroxiredoxin Q/BCP